MCVLARFALVLGLVLSLGFAAIALPHPSPSIDIFDAAREGDIASITAYAEQGGKLNVRNSSGFTPFILATYHGHDQAAAQLLEAGADACAVDQRGSNAYMGVAFKGYVKTTQWLLDHSSCDINHQNGAGQTALMMASLFGQEDVVQLLLAYGADPTIVDDDGNTAASLARAQGLGHILEILQFHFR